MYDWTKIPRGAFALTLSDDTADPGGDLKIPGKPGTGFRGVWCDAGGALKVTFCDGSTGVFAVAAKTIFWGEISRVWSTGTDNGVCTYGLK